MMKQLNISNAFLLVSLLALTACPGKNTNNQANVVTPQGRITSLSNAGTYCDINNGTIVCTSINQTTGAACSSLAKTYNPADLVNFCQQVAQLRNESANGYSRCDVTAAVNRILSESCTSVIGQQNLNNPTDPNTGLPNTGNPNLPGGVDQSLKTIQCDFEAQRESSHRFLSMSSSIPKTTALITVDSRIARTIDLRTKFLGIDIGKFGTLSMRYRPAAEVGTADTIILQVQGMKVGSERVNMSRSGFAGDEVRLESQSDGLYMTISCRGTGSQFVGATQTSAGNLVCTGKSNTVGSYDERIDVVMPLSQVSSGQDFALSQSVTAKIDANGRKITYTAVLDRDYGPTIVASSSLRSAAKLMAADRVGNIDVTCKIQ